MVLEATVICVDNSEWMRNGDYTPTRMEAQHDAVNLICGAKTQQNPENTVAAVAAAGKSPEVLVTLTSDLGKLLSSLHGVKITGRLNFMQTIQVAQLVLKHRQNKSQHQRIIFFVGSPIEDSTDELVKLAKRLKKNNVAVDVVNFGEEEANTEKLEAFISAVKGNDPSNLVNIPPGPHVLSDIVISSPIITGGEEAAPGVSSGGPPTTVANDFAQYGGVDPNLDPELALALKVSLEEARAKQEAEAKQKGEQEPAPAQPKETSNATTSNTTTTTTNEAVMTDAGEEDDELLLQAIAMSMQQEKAAASQQPQPQQPQQTQSQPQPQPQPQPQQPQQQQPVVREEEMQDIDDEMALALQMSMQQSTQPASSTDKKETTADVNKVMEDPDFVNSVLASLPGVDPNDETIKNVLQSISKANEKKDEGKK